MIAWINLFLVPMVTLSIYYRRKKEEPSFSPRLLMRYAIAASCNIPAAKVFIVAVRVILNREISLESGYYTAAALLSAALLPYIAEFLQKSLKIRCEITEHHETEK